MNKTSAYLGLKDPKLDNDNPEIASKFSNRKIEGTKGTGYLGYRDLPDIIKKYVKGKNALDYGCGTGYSTHLLKSLGLHAIGIDISSHMLTLAKKNYPDITFKKIDIGQKLPYDHNCFDIVLSTFVLFDIPTLSGVQDYLNEAKRVLKPDGTLIITTGSENFHVNNWLTIKNSIEINKKIKSTESYSVELLTDNIIFHDIYYSNEDYIKTINNAGMSIVKYYLPLGKISDKINWLTEWQLPPYAIYVCSPSK